MTRMPRPKKDPYVVSDSTCKGCIHYAPLADCSITSTWCCTYILDTGHRRPEGETCAECSVRELREGPRKPRRVQIHIEGSRFSKKQYEEPPDPNCFCGGDIVNTKTRSIESIKEAANEKHML